MIVRQYIMDPQRIPSICCLIPYIYLYRLAALSALRKHFFHIASFREPTTTTIPTAITIYLPLVTTTRYLRFHADLPNAPQHLGY